MSAKTANVVAQVEPDISEPFARDEMDEAAFHAILQRGMDDVKSGRTSPVQEAFAEVRKELGLDG